MWKWIVGGLAMIVLPILAAWAPLIILVMGSWEEICFDRVPGGDHPRAEPIKAVLGTCTSGTRLAMAGSGLGPSS